jgi:hypothetical protein
MNSITGSIGNNELQQALSGLSTVLGRGKGPHPAANSDPTSFMRTLLVGKAQAKREAGDDITARALETIIMQHDLGLIDLTWDAWKGTVIVSSRVKD